jgi:hypothetical protein
MVWSSNRGPPRDADLVINRDLLSLERLLDARDDRYDQRISDEKFVLQPFQRGPLWTRHASWRAVTHLAIRPLAC